MPTISYSRFRQKLAEIWNRVEETQEPVIVQRRGHQAMAILPARELESLRQTVHLLRSPRNAARLLTALHRATSDLRLINAKAQITNPESDSLLLLQSETKESGASSV